MPTLQRRQNIRLYPHNRVFSSATDTSDYVYAEFIQKPHGHGNEQKREDIGGGGDDCANDEQGNNDMAPVAAHHLGIDNAHPTHYPAYNGNFKYKPHGKAYHKEGIYVGLYGDGVLHNIADLIRSEETEREGKDEEVTEHHSQQEHDVASGYEVQRITSFITVQSRRYKTEQ